MAGNSNFDDTVSEDLRRDFVCTFSDFFRCPPDLVFASPNLSLSTVHNPQTMDFQVLKRSATLGIALGTLLTFIKRKKLLNPPKQSQHPQKPPIHRLLVYFLKFPLFFTSYSILYQLSTKLLLSQSSARAHAPLKKALSSFFSAYLSQRLISPIFNWNWALYGLLRALFHFARWRIPESKKPYNVDVHFIAHAGLIYLMSYWSPFIDRCVLRL